ncbi:MAG: hypothetical protein KY395_04825 [Actinobacteria bacterium]|nr:hypothetical protein [Actinomycetota bacterium]
MRTDCRNYESRSLRTGDSVQRCRLDLAPQAPWRCPADCPSFSPRPLDLAWEDGEQPAGPHDEPELTEAAFDILAQAESLLAEAGDSIRAEEAAKAAKKASRRRPFKRRR